MLLGRSKWGGEYETGRYTNTVEKPGKVVRCIQELFSNITTRNLLIGPNIAEKIIFFGKKNPKKTIRRITEHSFKCKGKY